MIGNLLMRQVKIDWFRVFVHTAALAPLALLIWDYTQDLLSVNPIEDITRRTGRTALTLLVLSLACTPANTVFGFKRALTVRRALGLYAFMYAGLHFLTFLVLDYGLDLGLIGDTIAEKRYVLIGFAAFLLLLPMALTSTRGWMKRLGRNWKTLHRFVYLAGVLAVVHFIWLVKSDITEPVRFGIVVAVLLSLRIPIVRKTISHTRNRLTGAIGSARSKRQTLQVSHNSTAE